METIETKLIALIENTIKTIAVENIEEERKVALQFLSNYIQEKVSKDEAVRINFICTHNSRRSHLAQIWAQTMAYYFNIKNVSCFSGGTESTALFPMVAETLEEMGFVVSKIAEGNNPIYTFKYANNEHPVICFSKKIDDIFNPISSFAAVMTCSQADAGCPFVPGAEKRIPIMFEDPKKFDGTPEQATRYKERSLQIATEMFYVFSQIKS